MSLLFDLLYLEQTPLQALKGLQKSGHRSPFTLQPGAKELARQLSELLLTSQGRAREAEGASVSPAHSHGVTYLQKQLRWCFELLCLQSPFFASFHTWNFHIGGAHFVKTG